MDGAKGENLKFFSIQELAKHDGSNESLPLLLSVQGMIFDVSESRGFYGPGGPYAVFAGKECARALAIMSTDPADCNGKVADLPNDKKEVLRDWQRKFLGKYRVVGAIEGAAWDTTTRSPTRTFKRPKPSGHNTPIVVAVAGVAVAGAAVALSVLLARS